MKKNYIKYDQPEKEFNEMIQHMANLCAIPSISKYSSQNTYPFGEECNNALNYALKLSKEFGFDIYKDPKKMYGFAQIGKSDKIIAILAHLDVVPEGDKEQWTSDAFSPIIDQDKIFGRGSLDDKGPTIINLYAMKYIKDNNLLDEKFSIRIIFGLSEETNMLSMKAYLKDFGLPYISYTPDGEWPLIYAEKLIYHVNLWFPEIPNFKIEGGKVLNQIPDSVYVKYPNIENIIPMFSEGETKFEQNKGILKIIGKSGHGSTPEKGDNAIIKFFKVFEQFAPQLKSNALLKFINQNFIDNKFDLENIFPEYDDYSGKLTANLGIIRSVPGQIILGFDLRVPVTHDRSNIFSDLSKYFAKLNNKIQIEPLSSKPAKIIDKDHKLVRILIDTYNEYYGEKFEPIAIGGGTYSRLFDQCVAFGSTKFMHLMHGPNEFFTFKEIKDSLQIYINALYRLQDYDNE